ncbi:MAG: chromosomal replication initiator protein DnaA [Dehalococcoidia bacterium]
MNEHQSKKAQNIWQAVLGKIEMRIPKASFETWLKDTSGVAFDEENSTINVKVNSSFTAQYLQERMAGIIERELNNVSEKRIQVNYLQGSEIVQNSKLDTTITPIKNDNKNIFPLNPKYTFDSFVVGDTNQLAFAGAKAVSDSPGTAFNPIVFYSGVGLGKTHLLHAIGHSLRNQGKNALYITSEEFTNQYISSIKHQTTESFRLNFRNVDALLIDDLQFLIGKEQTQEGFFHTFNELHLQNKQIVVALDRPLSKLDVLQARITSRLSGGLTADIQKPSYETRMAILQSKASTLEVQFPNNIYEIMAKKTSSNIRQLEGILNRVAAWSQFNGNKATSNELLNFISNDIDFISQSSKTFTSEEVIKTVAEHFSVTQDQIKGKQRRTNFLIPRQITMYILREETSMSLSAIGKVLGNRDHSTVLHGCLKISELMLSDDKIKKQIFEIKDTLLEVNS